MLGFRVQVNADAPVTAGAEDLMVLSAVITASGKLGPQSVPARGGEQAHVEFRLGGVHTSVGDAEQAMPTWLHAPSLKIGDRIVLEVVDTQRPDAARNTERVTGTGACDPRAHYERCKQVYFEQRDRYEGPA